MLAALFFVLGQLMILEGSANLLIEELRGESCHGETNVGTSPVVSTLLASETVSFSVAAPA